MDASFGPLCFNLALPRSAFCHLLTSRVNKLFKYGEFIDLSKKKCIPCSKTTPPLKGNELKSFVNQLNPGWKVVDQHHLQKEYPFKNFQQALDFTNKVGALAEQEGHHPDIHLSWGLVKIILWTHKINGLSENDFILAAKCDAALP